MDTRGGNREGSRTAQEIRTGSRGAGDRKLGGVAGVGEGRLSCVTHSDIPARPRRARETDTGSSMDILLGD